MLKVIGAGFGRTGTHSLGAALETLGYGPCYNIHEVPKNDAHLEIWKQALDGKSIEWNNLFESYHSTVEWPAVAFLPELIHYYPKAKVILTLRDSHSWYLSASSTIFEGLEISVSNPDPTRRKYARLNRRLVLQHTFKNQHRNKDRAIEIYMDHQDRVRDLLPNDRLLEYRIQEGWDPLCQFLGTNIPDKPFPKLNQKAEFMGSAPDWAKRKHKDRDRK